MYGISWDEFERLSVDLAKNIQESNQKYDQIVCVARGGLLLGRLLSEILDLPLGIISAKCDDNKYIVKPEVSSFKEIQGNILLVDDILEETINIIADHLFKRYKNIKKIDCAGIFYRQKKDTQFVPNFYINKVIEKIWIDFPYQTKSLKKHADI